MKDRPIYIPIGIDCSAAHSLRRQGLRKEAFPFDWNVTPIKSALSLIANGFQDFLQLENLEFLPPARRQLFEEAGGDVRPVDDIITPVLCHRYGILFPHDFSGKGPGDYPQVRAKYDRRIQRLKDVMASPVPKTLVFHIGQLNDWQMDQYRTAERVFEQTSAEEVALLFTKLSMGNARLMPLAQMKTIKSAAKERGKHLLSRLKALLR